MAWMCARVVFQTSRRNFCLNIARCNKKDEFTHPWDHATGPEKREMMAIAGGDDDPFNLKAIKRTEDSTKDKPNLVPSAFKSRIVGCICEDDQMHVNWMWLHSGAPRRCECGHWFKLVDKTPI
ncbi:hypothetical protein KM043_014675 [Ampulex compressa]|nr:hypothetical protein KM043_014675 [Ampulex compressa]